MDILRKYFKGQLSAQDEMKVQKWLVENGDTPRVVSAIEEIMSELEASDIDLSSTAFQTVKSRLGIRTISFKETVKKVAKWTAYAAVVMLLPLLGALVYSQTAPQTEWLEMKVPYGQTAEVSLPDGSLLRLNPGSRITYPTRFDGKERRVFVDGEIFAEVTSDPKKPFVVSAGDVDVNVFGTTFNFKAYDSAECVELFLLEGSVRMDISYNERSRQIQLDPGDVIQYDRQTGEVERKKYNPLQYHGFHENGAIHFFNMRLSDIASDLERYFNTKIVVLDESIADCRYFALFTNNETLDQILDGVNVDGKMKFIKKDDVIYIAKK